MSVQKFLSDLMITTIADGTLCLSENAREIRFTLINKDYSVAGRVYPRSDWIDEFGRPGLMPVIEGTALTYGEDKMALPLPPEEVMSSAYELLQERLAPEKLFTFDNERGWLLTSFYIKPLRQTDKDAA